MSYLEQSLSAGEKIEGVFKLHWMAWIPVWLWVEIDQGVLGRMLGFGTVRITGRGVSDFLFKGVDDPLAVKRTIESIGNPID